MECSLNLNTAKKSRTYTYLRHKLAHDTEYCDQILTYNIHDELGRVFTAPMPICIECRYPVKTLWTQYSGADDKSNGHLIRLTVCRKCGNFCDKYVEHDFVVLFIDLVLIKPQVLCLWPLTMAYLTSGIGISSSATQYSNARWRSLRRTSATRPSFFAAPELIVREAFDHSPRSFAAPI